jgi:hypothetical protein
MIDGAEGGAGAAEVTDGAGGAVGDGGAGGAGGGEGGAQTPEFLGALPDDLKADPTLVKYKDLEALARGHLETKKLASSKIVVPGEGASEEDMAKFYTALGRPESPDKYELPMPQLPVDAPAEAREQLAESYKPFRELAHKIGLNPAQAEALGQFELDRQNAYYQQGETEIAALKAELGADYDPKLEAGKKAFARIFGGDEEALKLAGEMDQKAGSARLVKAMMRLGEIMGEHKIIDGDHVEGFGEVKDPEGKLAELQRDKSWREKFEAGDAGVIAQRNRLLEAAQSRAARGARVSAT